MTEIKTTTDKVILNGHANTQEECETITLLANALKQSSDFRTIKYESGYAEFEKVGKTNDLKFPPSPASLAINWDSNITSVSSDVPVRNMPIIDDEITIDPDEEIVVVPDNTNQYAEWMTSGQWIDTNGYDGTGYTFTVSLKEGYILDTITLDDGGLGGSVARQTDSIFTMTCGVGGASGTITLTSRKAVVEPTYKFKHLYKNDKLIGTSAVKFRPYTVAEPIA